MKTKFKIKYYNIYGARFNDDKSRVNISLIRETDSGENEWATISLKNEKVVVKEKGVYIPVLFLKDFGKENKDFEKENKDEDATLPF